MTTIMKPTQKRSYLTIIYVALFAIAAFIGSTLWLLQKISSETAAIKKNEVKITEAKLSVFQAYVKKTFEKYDYITKDLVNRKHSGNVSTELKRLHALDPKIMDILYMNRDGFTEHWTGNGLAPIAADREFYTKLKDEPDRERYISSAKQSRARNRDWFFSISRPIKNETGEFNGALVLLVTVESLKGDLEKQLTIGDSSFAVFKENGSVLMRLPMSDQGLGQVVSNIPLSSQGREGTIVYQERMSPFDGKVRRTAWIYLPEYKLWTVITQPKEDLERLIENNFSNNLILAFFVYTFLILFTAIMIRQVIKSRRKLKALHESKVELTIQAERDPLTGLYNRRYFDVYAKREISKMANSDNKICIVFIDADHFKAVNDTYGHAVGDQVIISIANCLSHFQRTTDCVVRYGGEEFVVLLSNTTAKQACQYAELIRLRIEELHNKDVDSCPAPITVSIGLTMITSNETTVDAALKRADSALYKAKNSGRNCFKIQ
jgi:diguanylate cyclase (GGDEF)-like protein